MMKRKLTQALMLAAMFVGVGSLGSCKDYDEDMFNDIHHVITDQNATLTEYINAQIGNLQGQIDALKAAQEQCKNTCADKFAYLESLIQQLQQKDAELQNAINTKADQSTVTALQSEVETLKNNVQTEATQIASLQTAITTIEGDITTINNTLEDLKPRVEKNEQDIATLFNNITTINTTITTIQGDINNLKSRVENLEVTVIPGMQTDITTALTNAANAQAAANQAQQDVDNLTQIVNDYKIEVDGRFNDLKEYIDSLAKVSAKNFETAIALAEEANEALKLELLQEIQNVVTNYQNADAALQSQIDQLASDIAAVEAGYKAADDVLKADYIQKIADAKQEVLDLLEPRIADLETKYAELVAKDAELEGKINDLEARVAANEAAIENLKKSQASLITSLVIQEVNNPVFGGVTTPFGINTNILMGYYGKYIGSVAGEFPAQKGSGLYVNDTYSLTAGDMAMLGSIEKYTYSSGETLVNGDEDEGTLSLGKVYVTVNPTNVDFTGTQFDLVNSLDEKCLANLSPLKPSDRHMQFGVQTRAGVDGTAANGLYEAEVTIPTPHASMLAFHVEGIKTAVKDVLNYAKGLDVNRDGIVANEKLNVGNIAKAIYNNLGGQLDAQAVRASWTDPLLGSRSVYSNYGIAATTLECPFSYSSFKDFNYQTLPGYDRAWSLIDRIAGSINSRVHSAFHSLNTSAIVTDVNSLHINDIQLQSLSPELLAKFVITIDKQFSLAGKTVHFNIDQDVQLPIVATATADINGTQITLPSIHVTGTNDADILVPVMDENDNYMMVWNGAGTPPVGYDAVEFVTAAQIGSYQTMGYSQALGTFQAGAVTIDGVTASGVVVTIEGQAPITVNINQTVQTHLTLNDLEFTIPDSPDFVFSFTETVDLSDEIEELWGNVSGQITNVNDMLAQLRKIVDDVKHELDVLNGYEDDITGTVNNVAGKLQSLIQKLNDAVVGRINNLNYYLQPVLVKSDKGGARVLSRAIHAPTAISASTNFFPTNMTAEVLAPALRKHVAVTNVYTTDLSKNAQAGDAACKSALQAVNKDRMNKVLPGDVQEVHATGFQTGYVYEVALSCVDYEGMQATRKFYVYVK